MTYYDHVTGQPFMPGAPPPPPPEDEVIIVIPPEVPPEVPVVTPEVTTQEQIDQANAEAQKAAELQQSIPETLQEAPQGMVDPLGLGMTEPDIQARDAILDNSIAVSEIKVDVLTQQQTLEQQIADAEAKLNDPNYIVDKASLDAAIKALAENKKML